MNRKRTPAQRQRIIEYMRRYNAAHRESAKIKRRAYYLKNRERIKRETRDYYRKNKKKVAERVLRYCRRNRAKRRAYARALYYRRHEYFKKIKREAALRVPLEVRRARGRLWVSMNRELYREMVRKAARKAARETSDSYVRRLLHKMGTKNPSRDQIESHRTKLALRRTRKFISLTSTAASLCKTSQH